MGTARMLLTRGSVETTHHAVFAGGFGLDAAVVLEAGEGSYRKYRFGSLHYARTTRASPSRISRPKAPRSGATHGDSEEMGIAALLQFRQVYTYFGAIPLRVSPERPDPMTLLMISRLRRRRIPGIVTKLLRNGELDTVPEMNVVPHVKRIEVTADPPVAVQADGESLGLVDGGIGGTGPGLAPDRRRAKTPSTIEYQRISISSSGEAVLQPAQGLPLHGPALLGHGGEPGPDQHAGILRSPALRASAAPW